MPSRGRARTVLLSSVVGAIATGADVATLSLLVALGRVPVRIASVSALLLGILVQFLGNKLFAFADHSRAWLRQGVQFLLVEALGFAANLALFDLAVTHTRLPLVPLRLATTSLVYFALCLPLWSLIFHKPRSTASEAV
jgi:putative flippase GtrA